MPNWCQNEVKISGNKEDITKLIDLITDKFDFNKIIPMPEELEGFTFPVQFLSQEEFDEQENRYKEWLNTPKEKRKSLFIRGMTKEMSDNFKEQYGYNNWHNWCVGNWGVKWNVNTDEVHSEIGETWARYEFLTPWNPPEGIYEKLSELFPDLSISWFYKEPSMGISGWL